MAAFGREFQTAFFAGFFFESYSEGYETSDGFRAFFYHESDGLFVVVIGAGFHCVIDVFFEIVVFVQDCRDAALCVICVGFGYAFFCHDCNVAFFGYVQGKIEP